MTSAALANIAWFLPSRSSTRILSVGTGERVLTDAIVRSGTASAVVVGGRDGEGYEIWGTLSEEQGTFDLVVVEPYSAPARSVGRPPKLMAGLRQCMVPGTGSLLCRVHLTHTPFPFFRIRTLLRDLKQSGYTSAMAYYVSPSARDPSDIIPLDTKAILVWDDQTTRSKLRRAVRRLIIQCGFHSVFFDELLVIAR